MPKKNKKLIPFDYYRAMKGEPVVARNGVKVKEIKPYGSVAYPVDAYYEDGQSKICTRKGLEWKGKENPYDLFMAEEEIIRPLFSVFHMPSGRRIKNDLGGYKEMVDTTSTS